MLPREFGPNSLAWTYPSDRLFGRASARLTHPPASRSSSVTWTRAPPVQSNAALSAPIPSGFILGIPHLMISVTIRVALVSCVKSKQARAAPACDLYTSQLFRYLRGYAKANADCWYILSAEHGLLRPEQVIAPYERTLNKMGKVERLAWAERVQRQLLDVLPSGAEVIVLAGERYRSDLVPFLTAHGYNVSVPLEGLPLGRQLQRLKELAGKQNAER